MSSSKPSSDQDEDPSSKKPQSYLDILSFQNPAVVTNTNDTERSQKDIHENSAALSLTGPAKDEDKHSQNTGIELNSLPMKSSESSGQSSEKPKKPETQLTKSVRENDEDTVKQWITYLDKVRVKGGHGMQHLIPLHRINDQNLKDIAPIDQVDDYDPHYNAVHNAVITNNVKLLDVLHEAGADVNCHTNDQAGNTPLVLAVFRFSDEIVEESSHGNQQLVPSLIENSKTTFHALLKYSKVLEEINKASLAGITALHAACRRGNAAMVNILLGIKGIGINQKDHHNNAPLHAACAGGNTSVVASLISEGAEIQTQNKHGMHPFHVAVVSQSLEVVKMIQTDRRISELKEKLLHDKERDGNTMFLLAVKSGDDKIVEFLLENGAHIEDTNSFKANAFHLAATTNSFEIMKMIYDHCKAHHAQYLLEAKDADSLTPLHYAARKNQKEVLSFLIEKCKGPETEDVASKKHSKLEVEDAELNTPLLIAAAKGSSEAMGVLIKEGAKLTRTDGKGNNIVHLMVSSDNSNVLKAVLDSQEFPTSTLIDYGNWTGQSALHRACKSGFTENCIELLNRGANPNLKDSNGFVPLHYAAESGNLEVVQFLISHHAYVDAVDDSIGQTPLCKAAYHGHEAIVELLIQSGAHIDGKFPDPVDNEVDWRSSPLFASCINGHVRVVKSLLEKGADVTVDKRFEDDEGKWHIKGNCLVLSILLGQKDVALCIVTSPKWKSALRWRSKNDKFAERTPLKLLISQMPDVAEVVLSKCIKTIKKQNGTYVKKYYYEFLEDFHRKDYKKKHADDKKTRGHHHWLHHDFKREAHTFQVMIDNKRTDLLNHPLSFHLLTYKWRSYGIFIYYINLISYLIFLAFLTGFTLSLQNPKTEECRPQDPTAECQGNGSQAFLSGAAAVIIAFSVIRIAVEAFQVYYRPFRYFLEFENWMELYLYSSAIAFVGFGLAADCHCTEFWQWEFGAVTLLIAWLNLVLFLKKFPLTGVYVLMFLHIMSTVLKILLLPILFVVSFGLTFYMLFFRPDMKTAFSSPANSILRTMMLTMGEFDFDDLFYNTAEDNAQGNGTDPNALPAELLYPGATYLLWIVFVIVMPIVLINMLTGLAVDDIKGIQDESHLKRLALEVDFTLHIEEIGFIRQLFIKRMSKEYYTPSTSKFADEEEAKKGSTEEPQNKNEKKQEYNMFQRFKLYYFGRSKSHQDDIKVVDEKSSTERIEEELSEISVVVADVRKKVKNGINGKDIDTNQTGNVNEAKELADVKKLLADQDKKQTELRTMLVNQEEKQRELSKMLAEQNKKQDLLLRCFTHVYPNLPEELTTAEVDD